LIVRKEHGPVSTSIKDAPQSETPLKLGNWAELVLVADKLELALPLPALVLELVPLFVIVALALDEEELDVIAPELGTSGKLDGGIRD
jgi:hypothetical protein